MAQDPDGGWQGSATPRSTPLNQLFAHMDQWRHLPAYQLERRADIFFSAYLPDVVAAHTGFEVAATIVPELPIRRDLIWPNTPSKASVKVDYAVFASDRSKVFFVELKTDTASRRTTQDTYLLRSVEVGFRQIVGGIVDISQASKARQKYGHLLHVLADMGCLTLPPALYGHLWPAVRPSVRKLLRDIDVTVAPSEFAVEVLYVKPTRGEGDGDNILDFETFATHVARHADPISQRFAASLREWVVPAGSVAPGPERRPS